MFFFVSKITNLSVYTQISMTKAGWARIVFNQTGGSVRWGEPLYVVVGISILVLGQFMLYFY